MEVDQKCWERKPLNEIEQIKNQFRESSFDLKIPVTVFLASFLGIWGAYSRYNGPNPIQNGLIISAIAFIATLILQYAYGRSFVGKSSFKICNQCHGEDNLGNKKCSCGGHYEPSEFYNKINEL